MQVVVQGWFAKSRTCRASRPSGRSKSALERSMARFGTFPRAVEASASSRPHLRSSSAISDAPAAGEARDRPCSADSASLGPVTANHPIRQTLPHPVR